LRGGRVEMINLAVAELVKQETIPGILRPGIQVFT
jgi:hypothetical protein